jgi:hypothetical protein
VRIGQLDDAGELHGVVDSQPCDAAGPRLAGEELAAGHYVATMTTTDGPAMATAFWVLDPLARPSIDVQKQRYALGEEIGIHWQNGPGSRNDYVAVFAADSAVGYDDGIAWTYVGARPSGQLRLGPSSSETGWPLPPGRYVARLMLDDGYDMLAESAPFSVE